MNRSGRRSLRRRARSATRARHFGHGCVGSGAIWVGAMQERQPLSPYRFGRFRDMAQRACRLVRQRSPAAAAQLHRRARRARGDGADAVRRHRRPVGRRLGLHYVVDYKATSKNGEVVICPELCLLRLRFEGVRRRLTARPPRGSCQRLRAGACRARKCRSPEMQSPARTSQGFLSPLTVARAGLSSPASRLGFRRIRR